MQDHGIDSKVAVIAVSLNRKMPLEKYTVPGGIVFCILRKNVFPITGADFYMCSLQSLFLDKEMENKELAHMEMTFVRLQVRETLA